MTQVEDLEALIRRYVALGKRSPKGYETVKCALCNDYKVRGGFKFDADAVIYSCFNCSAKAVYRPGQHRLSKTMQEVVNAFGLPDSEVKKVLFFEKQSEAKPLTPEQKKLYIPTDEVPLPQGSVQVMSDASPWCEVAREYLSMRGIDPASSSFFVTDNEKFAGRLIIPHYFREKIVYWQGRAMDGEIEPRYKNPVVEKENIFFNMDEVYRYTDEPLFVTEGALDAISIGRNAVSLTGSTLSEFREAELIKAASRRKVIFVLDKNQNGRKLGNQVLKDESIEWYVTCFLDNVEDANDALKKLGKLWIITHLASTAVKGFQGKLLIRMKC